MATEDHKLAAIVFTDIVGYTKRMEENEQHTMHLLQKQREIVFPLVKAFGGEVVKEIGDGLLMMFSSALDAVRFAITVQSRLRDEELTIRAGIHIGDIIFRDGDVFGSAVNTAARIEPLAPPNGICISEDVKNQLQNKSEFRTISRGKKELKGVKNPIDIHEVYIEGVTQLPTRNLKTMVRDLWNRAVIQIMAGYLISAWIIKQAVASVVSNYLLSPYLTDLTWVILLSLTPTVFLLSYFHGRRKTSTWTRLELIGLPANIAFTLLLVIVMFQGKDLGAATTNLTVKNEQGEEITRKVSKSEFRKKLALFFFENQTGKPQYDWLQYGITTALQYDLSQDLFADAVSATEYLTRFREAGFPDGLRTPLTLKKEITNNYHRDYFTTGTFQLNDQSWEITTQVYQADKGTMIQSFTLQDPDIFSLIDRVSSRLKEATGIPEQTVNSSADLPLAEILTSSLEAFRYYIRSLEEIYIRNNWTFGIELAEKAIQTDQDFVFAHLNLAEYYFNSNQPDKAKQSLQITMDKLYKLPERNQYFAKFFYYLANQKADQANAVIKMVTELFPDDLRAHAILAQRYQMKNQYDEAIAEIKKVVAIAPEDYEYIQKLGELYENIGNYDSSLHYYMLYALKYPKEFKSYTNLGTIFLQMANFEKARENYEWALLLDPGNSQAIIKLVAVNLREGKLNQALELLEASMPVCKTANDSALIFGGYERLYEQTGKINRSFEYNQKKLAAYETILPPLRNLVYRTFTISKFVEAGRENEALALLNQIESEFQPPFDKVAAFGYLFYYTEIGDATSAEKYIPEAIELIEGFGEEMLYANIHFAKARIAEIRGDYRLGIEEYLKYQELSPSGWEVYRWLASCYRHSRDIEKAMELIEKALRHHPNDPENLLESARCFLDKGDTAHARGQLQKAVLIWSEADEIYKPAQEARRLLDELGSA